MEHSPHLFHLFCLVRDVETEVETKVDGRSSVSGEQKVVMANRAGRLLRTVKLLLAREKSYDLSSAEGRKGGRRLSKSSSSSR